MRRKVMAELAEWKNRSGRKPLVLKGARQVGKTWLMQEFGAKYYENTAYFNFDEEDELNSIFERNKNPQRIVELLSMLSGTKIEKGRTLIIFDEIQGCPEALGSLKYFKEKAGEYHIVSAGSLLGTLLATPKSFPVGMVNLINLYPLTFDEFLEATDENLFAYYRDIRPLQQIEEIFHSRLLEAYRNYLIIGGMPECVQAWSEEKDPAKIERVHHELLTIYENDFSKHNGDVNAGRILMVFRGIVSQLAKQNEKFIYECLREGARAREFETAIEWLVSAGVVNRVYNVSKPEHPLAAFDRLNNFKLFLFDTGLLKYMSGLDNKAVLLSTDYQFKGPLTENYFLQQVKSSSLAEPRFFARGSSEIDFLIAHGTDVIPIEVKGGKNKSAASFKAYIKERNPSTAIRFSERGYRKDGEITNIPLYLAPRLAELLYEDRS